jgi:hypothetical protein
MLSLPDGASSLESILCTEELRRRPSRPPDYEKENHALVALRSVLTKSGRRRFFARGKRRRIRTVSCAVLHEWRGVGFRAESERSEWAVVSVDCGRGNFKYCATSI